MKWAMGVVLLLFGTSILQAADHPTASLPDEREAEAAQHRRTLFGPVDQRSEFGQAWFPENLRAPEMDLEYSEVRLDWFHSEKKGRREDQVKIELEKAFGSLTLEVEAPWVREEEREVHEGVEEIEVGLRYPIFQFVSSDAKIDYTAVGVFEFALPTGNDLNKDSEISPRLYNLLRVGDHLAIQASIGWAKLIGPENGGADAVEYGLSLGWVMQQRELHIPKILTLIPMAEWTGEQWLSGDEEGHKENFATVGFRVNTESMGFFQPRIGVGYVFPIDDGAREQMRWGILFSVVFEL